MPLIVDTDRRATFPLKTGARLRYESSMNKVWWEQILHESLEDGSWWMKNMLRARKHSNISPFMILRRIFGVWIRNWRDVHVNIAWRNRIDQFKIEKKKGVLERVKFKIDKCSHWWNVVRACFTWNVAFKSIQTATTFPACARKRCPPIWSAVTLRFRLLMKLIINRPRSNRGINVGKIHAWQINAWNSINWYRYVRCALCPN